MRTIIEIPINYHPDEAYARLRNYFETHGYEALQIGYETVMRGGDKMLGHWYVVPQVFEGKVVIQGFVGAPGKKEKNLDGFVGAMIKAPARTALDDLFKILFEQNPASNDSPNNPHATQQQPYAYQNNQYPNAGNQAPGGYVPVNMPGTLSEKNAKYAIWSVVMGGVSCLLAIFGGYVTFILLIFGIWFGFTARKTSKRNLATVGIVLNFVAIALFILGLIVNFFTYY